MNKEEKELILRPDRQGLSMVLGELEADIMDVIWRRSEGEWCTVRDVYETMLPHRHIAYTTVMNTMTRLAKKGVLESAHRDQAYLYRPRQSRDNFIHGIVGHVLERLLVQFTGPTQSALNDYSEQHPGERDKVNNFLKEITQLRRKDAAPPTEEDAD